MSVVGPRVRPTALAFTHRAPFPSSGLLPTLEQRRAAAIKRGKDRLQLPAWHGTVLKSAQRQKVTGKICRFLNPTARNKEEYRTHAPTFWRLSWGQISN